MTTQVTVNCIEVLSDEPQWYATLTVPNIHGGGVITGDGTTCYTAVRHAWEKYESYLKSARGQEATAQYARSNA